MALVIWDHAVCLRERLLWSDTCEPGVPRLVREVLARLHHAAACVLYKVADLVVPCCATFNVGWEMWLGRPAEGILPVLNGLDVTKVSFVHCSLLPMPVLMQSPLYCTAPIPFANLDV